MKLLESSAHLTLIGAMTLVIAGACKSSDRNQTRTGPPTPSTPTPSTPAPSTTHPEDAQPALPGQTQFQRLVIKDFNWEIQGYDVLVVNQDGQSTYLAARGTIEKRKGEEVMVPVWHRVEWSLDSATLETLKDKLGTFRELEELYIDRSVEDGQSIEFILVDDQGEKRVQCSNEFPRTIQDLRSFIAADITGPHRAKLAGAPQLSREEAQAYWEQF